jgi:hypothetical protein
MKQIFYFQFSKEVYVRLRWRLIKAAKWHILSHGYDTASIVQGLFSSYAFFTRATEKFKSFKISYKCK